MKTKVLNFILLSSLLSLIALSNCSDNRDNHANTPPGAPDSEYPGNRSDSTGTHPDSLH
jgi:hypothetical protein